LVRYGVGMRLGLMVVMSMALASGCALANSDAGADTDDFIDMDTPPGNCSAGTSAQPCPNADSSGNPVGASCFDSDDCTSGTSCVAPYQAGEVGEFTCTDQCLPMLDENAWCFDASACCEPSAVCRRGLCVPPEETGSSGTDSSGTGIGTEGPGTSDGSGSTSADTGAATGTTGMR